MIATRGRGVCAVAVALAGITALPDLASGRVRPRDASADAEETPVEMSLRAGAGVDSNALRAPQGGGASVLVHGDGHLDIAASDGWRVLGDGTLDADTAGASGVYAANAGLLATWSRELTSGLSLSVGSFTEYDLEPSVDLEGRVLTTGAAVRDSLSEHLGATLAYELGARAELELGARGEVERVDGLEQFYEGGIQAMAGLRVAAVPRRFFLRLRSTLDVQHYDSLTIGASPTGEAGDTPQTVADVYVPALRASARIRPSDAVSFILHADQAWISGRQTSFLNGTRQWFDAELLVETERLEVEVAGDALRRSFDRAGTADEPNQETELEAVADVTLYLGRALGLFARYEYQHVTAAPFGLVFERHAALVGLAIRYAAEGGVREAGGD